MAKIQLKNILLIRILRNLMVWTGIFFTVCVILAFTTLPFKGYHWLGTSKSELVWEPEVIVLLGGGGMPSRSALMRSWYTEQAAKAFPGARIVIAMPGDLDDGLSTPQLMKKELAIRGVDDSKISFEAEGTNTRAQAVNCKRLIKMQTPLLLVTSPEHMRRSVLSFRKAGFEKVNALPAFENAVEADLTFTDGELGGNVIPLPGIGNSLNVRYQLWNHLQYEILIVREWMALTYYKLRGWI